MTIRRFVFGFAALLSVTALFSAVAARARDATLDFIGSLFIAQPQTFWDLAPAVAAAPVLGRSETRAYATRRLQRVGDHRSRAPDSMAFVGRL